MSSTVTTATVSTVTAAITTDGLGPLLTLIALLLFGAVLLAKEIAIVARSGRGRALARGLDIGFGPMLVAFLLIVAINAASYIQAE